MKTFRTVLVAASLSMALGGCAGAPLGQATAPAATPGVSKATDGVGPTQKPAPSAKTLPEGTTVIGSVALPALLLPGDDAIWAAESTRILRLDPETDRASVVVSGLAAGHHATVGVGDAIWSVDTEAATVTEYDAITGKLRTTLPVGKEPLEPVVAFGSLWVPNHHDGTLTRIDLETSSIAATIEIGEAGRGGPSFMAAGAGLLWAVPGRGAPLVGVNPDTNKVVTRMPGCASGVGYAFDVLWLRDCEETAVEVRDPRNGDLLATVYVDVLSWPVEAQGKVWWPLRDGSPGTTTLVGVDPRTFAVTAEYVAMGSAESFAAGLDSFWFAGATGSEVVRVRFSALPRD